MTAKAALWAMAAAAMLALGGCSSHGFVPVPGDANGELHLHHDCTDPLWKQQNLGLWYSLCRKPMNL